MNSLDTTTLTTLLRSPRTIADAIGRGAMLRSIALTSLAAIALGMGVYGGVIGSVRGGPQIAFAAIKMPIVALVTLSLLAPLASGASRAFDLELHFDRATALVLAATARAALVLLALAPALPALGAGCPACVPEVAGGVAPELPAVTVFAGWLLCATSLPDCWQLLQVKVNASASVSAALALKLRSITISLLPSRRVRSESARDSQTITRAPAACCN